MDKTETEIEERKEYRREDDFELVVSKNYDSSTLVETKRAKFSDVRMYFSYFRISQTFPLISFFSISFITYFPFHA